MIAGFALIVTGFPMGASMGNAIFSKILGPFPQVCLGDDLSNLIILIIIIPIDDDCLGNLDGNSRCWRLFGSCPVPDYRYQSLFSLRHVGSLRFHDWSYGSCLDDLFPLLQTSGTVQVRRRQRAQSKLTLAST